MYMYAATAVRRAGRIVRTAARPDDERQGVGWLVGSGNVVASAADHRLDATKSTVDDDDDDEEEND